MDKKTVLIVGLGLIGGSLGLALCRSGKYRVLGTSRRTETVEEALDRGVIHGAADPNNWEEADIVLLCVSPSATVALLREHVGELRPGTVVSDVCGVKGALVAPCEELCLPHGVCFVGAHPMAGREKNGLDAADETLFRGCSYILTPTDKTDKAALKTMEDLALTLGSARVTVTTPENHDRMIAYTSQIPHVLAGAYVSSPQCEHHVGYAAGSYRDVSRVATIDDGLWSELFLLNRPSLGAELDRLIQNLTLYRDALTAEDEDALRRLIRRGADNKRRFG